MNDGTCSQEPLSGLSGILMPQHGMAAISAWDGSPSLPPGPGNEL